MSRTRKYSSSVRRGPIVSRVASTIRGMALESLSDDEVLSGLQDILRQSRSVESSLIAHLAEVDARRLFTRNASPSMFVYCRDVLHLSEGEAQLPITVAEAPRASRPARDARGRAPPHERYRQAGARSHCREPGPAARSSAAQVQAPD